MTRAVRKYSENVVEKQGDLWIGPTLQENSGELGENLPSGPEREHHEARKGRADSVPNRHHPS